MHDEIADLDIIITEIVDELALELIKCKTAGYEYALQLLITAGGDRATNRALYIIAIGR